MSSVQSLSHVQLFATPRTAACQTSVSITKFWSKLKLISIESVRPSNYLILCCPLLLVPSISPSQKIFCPLLPPSIFPSIGVFSNETILCIRWPNYYSFSFSISPSYEYSILISFKTDWLDSMYNICTHMYCIYIYCAL